MGGRGVSFEPSPGRRRCRCGHFPTHHMRVVPADEHHGGSFRLDPTAGCSVCGEIECPKFAPTG